jgi:hypothetical protein
LNFAEHIENKLLSEEESNKPDWLKDLFKRD